jgi:3-oxoacyl-[acyl-carrier-protein] synthase II
VRRVFITGLGAVTPFGEGVASLMAGLLEGRSGISAAPGTEGVGGLRSHVAGIVPPMDFSMIDRHHRRSMSAMSRYATMAAIEALRHAGLDPSDAAGAGVGVCVGSTVGSTTASEAFFEDYFRDRSLERMKSTLFFQIMNHSCAANVAQTLGLTGRVLAPSSACCTGCQTVGIGREMIAAGRAELMLCGGADEFHPLMSATFDILNAASTGYNATPWRTPRPFDRLRDGVVCSEGAGILLLESEEQVRSRGATPLAEITGFATLADPTSIANPSAEQIGRCMREALKDAGTDPGDIGYVNAHATATVHGDAAEASAIGGIFGGEVPVSSLKGHLGHTMGASGAIELVAVIGMIGRGVLVPTLNLEEIAADCAMVRHVRGIEEVAADIVLKNNFALGGVNSTIIVKRYSE